MTKVFIDSNVWIRPLVENSPQATSTVQLTEAINQGQLLPTTSTIVLLEANHVLISFYQISPHQVTPDLKTILSTKNLTLIEKTNFPAAIKLHQQTKVKLTDCVIATQCPPKTTFVTWDKDFQKFPNFSVKNPAQILKELD